VSASTTKQPVPTCGRCSTAHITSHGNQACTAHTSKRRPDGGLIGCTQPPVTALTVCRLHGASNPRSKAKAARARLAASASKTATIFGLPRQVDPAQGLIEEYCAAPASSLPTNASCPGCR